MAARPAIFTTPAAAGETPALIGGRCACDRVFFPYQPYGCEVCGAGPNEIARVELPGRGVLQSVVRVHRHGREDRDKPLALGRVALDDGPEIEVLLHGEGDFAVGGVFCALVVQGECRFVPAGDG